MDELKFARDIVNARQTVWHWTQVPNWWWQSLRNMGWLVPEKGRALAIYEKALAEADAEIKRRLDKKSKEPPVKLTKEDLAKIYAGKMYVFEEVLRNKNWQPIEQP
jgi:uncharacterized damage-inducible protein DinB